MSQVTAYYFWSPTCNPCKTIKPVMNELHDEFPEINWISVNTKEDPNGYKTKFNVAVVPTLVLVKNDILVGSYSGTNISIFYSLIRKALSTTA